MSGQTAVQAKLGKHAQVMRRKRLSDLFQQERQRGNRLSIELPGIFIDYSKNIITDETLDMLLEHAGSLDIKGSIEAMFRGEKINLTEKRPALHTALRNCSDQAFGENRPGVVGTIKTEREKLRRFVAAVHSGERRGWTGKTFDTFVNIGIGGSCLGAKMAVNALEEYRTGRTRSCFISNIDYQQIAFLQKSVNPETTLFIIASKSFTTIETRANAATLKAWLQACSGNGTDKHFVAVTANQTAAVADGIKPENCFRIWDWVNGRFSLWSAFGLPIALAIGFDHFEALLAGAEEMDRHFREAPARENAPIILALLDYWYNNFWDAETHAFIPYDESLRDLPDFLAQLFMESNGKSAGRTGGIAEDKTSPIVWGGVGADAQHSFFQLLHQGTHTVPVDFLVPLHKKGAQEHHRLLFANFLAQSRALLLGETGDEPYKHCEGNRPSTSIVYSELTPRTLGALIALFEHRVFVQGLLWRINSFDQWGVELGKKLASDIVDVLTDRDKGENLDSSTRNLINRYMDSHRVKKP